MTFHVKEIFYTLQGEGMQAGRAALFCRFSGCNLWSGREEDRATAACPFCDTDFLRPDAGVFSTETELVAVLVEAFPPQLRPAGKDAPPAGGSGLPRPYIVFTGGEPALQLTAGLVEELHAKGFEVGVESNGTLPLPPGLDWVCISPKAGTRLATRAGDELKFVWPQDGCRPEDFEDLRFRHFILQPRDGGTAADNRHNTQICIDYCLNHPRWRLGLQTHKWIGVR